MKASGKKALPRAGLVVLVFVVAVGVDILWMARAPEHDARVDAIRKKGYPVTLAELNAWYKFPAAEQNAAFVYTNAFAHMSTNGDFLDSWSLDSETVTAQDLEELRAVVATNGEVLRLLHSTVSLTNSRYPIDLNQGAHTLLPHLAKVKRGTILLAAEGLVRVAEHRNEQAMESFVAAGHLADSVSEEPTQLSQLVRWGSWIIVCIRLETALNGTHFSDKQLETLQTLITSAEKPWCFARGIVAERANGYAIFRDPKWQMILFGGADAKGWRSVGPRLLVGALRTTGIFAKDKNFFLDAMATNVAISELPFPEQFKASQGGIPLPQSRFYIVSRILLSSAVMRSVTRNAGHTAHLRITRTALAVERYRLANAGSLPDDLGQLVPRFLASVPADPFDGKPLRFKKLSPGFMVYSIGSDGRDDGGARATPGSAKSSGTPADITFKVSR